MKLTEIISGLGFLAVIAIACAALYGYGANIFKLLGASEFALLEVVRVIGLIVPFLGSFMGFVG